jgi:DNA invertase Pin-like site-specific DNA recombinase
MKFILYCRCSTKRQGQAYSIPAQKETIQRYLSSLPSHEVIAEYIEVESGANDERPKLAEAIALSKQTGARVCISKLDRLSRSASFLLKLMETQCDFVIAEMPSADKFTISILSCVAERERQLIAQRTREGLAVAKSRGVLLGNRKNLAAARQIALASVQTHKRAFIDSAIVPIREIMSTGVQSYAKIADCLRKRGEKTSRGKDWTPMAVRRVVLAAKQSSI